jgi:hypothetical protein
MLSRGAACYLRPHKENRKGVTALMNGCKESRNFCRFAADRSTSQWMPVQAETSCSCFRHEVDIIEDLVLPGCGDIDPGHDVSSAISAASLLALHSMRELVG